MRLKYLLAIAVTLLIMGGLFMKDRPANPLQTPEETDESAKKANADNPKLEQVIEKQAEDTKNLKPTQNTDEQAQQVQTAFADHLRELNRCFEVKEVTGAPLIEKADPTYENLTANLKASLGEVVVRMDDWMQQDFKSDDGSLRRVRTEMEYPENGNPVKRAQLYKINAQGMPELQPLNPEQATDPSDDFVSSLRGDAQVIQEEKGGRVYFQEGEELVMVERGGKIQSFSLTKGEKTFSCTETDATTSNCQCL